MLAVVTPLTVVASKLPPETAPPLKVPPLSVPPVIVALLIAPDVVRVVKLGFALTPTVIVSVALATVEILEPPIMLIVFVSVKV
jgi:hypothetical protein